MREQERNEDLAAAAWELEGALGLPFVVRGNGDLAVDPDALDEWWAGKREAVVAAWRSAAARDRA